MKTVILETSDVEMKIAEDVTVVRMLTGESAKQRVRIKVVEGVRLRFLTRYVAVRKAPVELDDRIEICARGAKIDYDCFGVLMEGAEKTLKFTLDFQAGATSSEGQEREEVLMLGKPKRNVSSPVILCNEPTISGSHGMTLGEMPEAGLNYLRARGLSEMEAQRLITQSRFQEAARINGTETLVLAKIAEMFDNSLMETPNEG